MRKFNITVDGRKYMVEVEELGDSTPSFIPAIEPQKVSVPVIKESNTAGVKVQSPMPGMIIDFKVPNGTTVKKGQPIIILEAMKMENDIVASQDGVITFSVEKGATVDTGTVLAIIA